MSTISRSPHSAGEHYEFLDALRGIGILGVVLVHSGIQSGQQHALFAIAFTGQRGVQLFYMLSAFMLYLTLESRRTEHFELSNFYIRRFFRIAPLFYLAIIGNILLNGHSLMANGKIGVLGILSGFLFLNGLRPETINSVAIGGWAIAVEMTFYLFVPLLFARIKNLERALALFIGSSIILLPISQWLAHRAVSGVVEQYFAFLWFPVEFPVFVLGVITYFVWKDYMSPVYRQSKERSCVGMERSLSLLLILASVVLYISNLPFTDSKLYLSSFLFLPFILGLSLRPWGLFVNRFTIYLGKISYSIYLCHFFVLLLVGYLLNRLDRLPSHFVSSTLIGKPAGLIAVFVLTLVISIPLCMFTWRWVEQPGIRLGKRWIARREQSAFVSNQSVHTE
jgi:peptidoglycan/LPS O-acetylase OafA/YrhL